MTSGSPSRGSSRGVTGDSSGEPSGASCGRGPKQERRPGRERSRRYRTRAHRQLMTPARSATATISARSPVPSLRAIRARWLFTVRADRLSSPPMSRLERPGRDELQHLDLAGGEAFGASGATGAGAWGGAGAVGGAAGDDEALDAGGQCGADRVRVVAG